METKDLCHYLDAKIIPVYLVPCKKTKINFVAEDQRATNLCFLFSLSKTFKTMDDLFQFFFTLLPDFKIHFLNPSFTLEHIIC